MYLTSKQHDKLRNIIMNFEIPFRTFIANIILDAYPTVDSFNSALEKVDFSNIVSQTFRSEIGRIKSIGNYIYDLMIVARDSMQSKIITEEVNVPNVVTLVALVLAFPELFKDYMESFTSNDLLNPQIEKYHYVRNKLNHPGCKTLEEQDMTLTLSFVSTTCVYIQINHEDCFWNKKEEDIHQEICALESMDNIKVDIINNFSEMPLLDRKIVCRDKEINQIKKFIYGVKGALRKKSSLCVFGYGGVGKTALVTESIKSIIQDVMDEKTINEYRPEFILFFTAKEEMLDLSYTSGAIQKKDYKYNFSSFEELQEEIYRKLNINSFSDFNRKGIIVVDNLETLNEVERVKIKEFIDYMSPPEIQYIITSRNEEEYEERIPLEGFEHENGKQFIKEYIEENELYVELNDSEKETLLDVSKGNTLVLVLSLRRLSTKIATIEGITIDLSKSKVTVETVANEFRNLPANGYEIISEFMFKNTFLELEKRLENNIELFAQLMRLFAVYPDKQIDIYTLCLLMNIGYLKLEPYLNLLCRYLILEKKNDRYSLNGFAEKYIVERFLPDSKKYEELSMVVSKSMREIQEDLDTLNKDLRENDKVKDIITDWFITYDGDKIAAAKAYHLFQNVNMDCKKETEYFVQMAYDNVKTSMPTLEKTTMHPYVKYQKARMLAIIYSTKILKKDIRDEVKDAFTECIWTIKTNALYTKIKSTKNFASVLWIFGNFLSSIGENRDALRYLEEGCTVFETLGIHDREYYQCSSKLGGLYIEEYKKCSNRADLEKARKLNDILYSEREYYAGDRGLRLYASQLRREVTILVKMK